MESYVASTLCVFLLSILQCVRTDLSAFWITDCDSSNRTKECFRHPPECVELSSQDVSYDGTSCEFVVTWQQTFNQDHINFEVYAPIVDDEDKEYLAIAFSENSKMARSDVLACLKTNDMFQVVHSWNGDGHVNELEYSVGVSQVSGSISNGILNCNFTRIKHIDGQSHFHDLRKDLYMLASRGKHIKGEIAYHTNGRHVSTTRHNFGSYTADPDPTTQSLTSDISYKTTSKHGQGPCSSKPCKNSGKCTATKNGFLCTCKNRYVGERCETDNGSSYVTSASLVTLLLTTLLTYTFSL